MNENIQALRDHAGIWKPMSDMETWEILVAFLGGPTLAVIALCTFAWSVRKRHQDEMRQMQNDIAWVNKDLAEVKKDVEWLVRHFEKGRES